MYYSKSNAGYILRLEIGEEVQEALRQFAETTKIKSAFYQGIGTIHQVELAFFCKDLKGYNKSFFDDSYELILLSGNLTTYEDTIIPHTHVCIGDRNFQTYSGHLVRGIISVTAEIILTPVDLSLTRETDPILNYEALVFPNREHLKVDV
jgi:predicted DNA-binding protein with PD1-like motif